ncbi:acetyl hydrolase [Bradyrhizobium sp. LTSP885]|uniref:alpha/beta hydrolase n=1 Tax=Bradyrhizobium sp. LTSP885 TaxID=1619232 RepID=UPI0005C86BC8|nr:alpha/beta hydrolase [Bradyrhizobium sp. LTSP885]KJC50482.1 acetyl hydrolase [Bradyrhizobium sp. LTSP885]
MNDIIDPSARRIVEAARKAKAVSEATLTPAEARENFRNSRRALSPEPPAVAFVDDLKAPGLAGHIPLRLYRGAGTDLDADLPVFLFFHSGGWVSGDLDTHDVVCRSIATVARCAVIAVDYRLAPEHRFPAAIDDGWSALTFVASQGASLKLDTTRIAVGGDSAGGNIAATLALMARDAGGPRLSLQVLAYPATDFSTEHASWATLADQPPLTRDRLRWFQKQYLRDERDRRDWRVSPLLTPDLKGVAPAFVATAGFDPLHDEGEAYLKRLLAAGVRVRSRRFGGQIHGFITMGKVVPEATTLIGEIAAALDWAFQVDKSRK